MLHIPIDYRLNFRVDQNLDKGKTIHYCTSCEKRKVYRSMIGQ